MSHKIRKAIIPAAGFGTRFLPVTKAQPKEMLPIVDKPVIQYLVEEAVASGIEEIIIVTGRGKRAIEDHFDTSYELENILEKRGKKELLQKVRNLTNLAKFIYVRQPEPLGDGHALLCAESIIGKEPCVVLFGDAIIDGKKPATKQMIEAYEKEKTPIIGLVKMPKETLSRFGVVAVKNTRGRMHTIIDIIEKPKPKEAPSNLIALGKYIITPDVFAALKKIQPGKDGELRLANAFHDLLKQKKHIKGVEIEGTYYDTGDTFEFLRATIDFALKLPDLGPKLRAYLNRLKK